MEASSKSTGETNKQSPHTTGESTVNERQAQATAADLTLFQLHMLRATAKVAQEDRRQHGLSVKAELETYYRGDVNHGRLYPNFDTLVEKELVEKSQLDKRTNKYVLTQKGYDVLEHVASVLANVVVNHDDEEEDDAQS